MRLEIKIEEELPPLDDTVWKAIPIGTLKRDLIILRDGEEVFRAHLKADPVDHDTQITIYAHFRDLMEEFEKLARYEELAKEALTDRYSWNRMMEPAFHYFCKRLQLIKEGRH